MNKPIIDKLYEDADSNSFSDVGKKINFHVVKTFREMCRENLDALIENDLLKTIPISVSANIIINYYLALFSDEDKERIPILMKALCELLTNTIMHGIEEIIK
jgi:hypothetical protein